MWAMLIEPHWLFCTHRMFHPPTEVTQVPGHSKMENIIKLQKTKTVKTTPTVYECTKYLVYEKVSIE